MCLDIHICVLELDRQLGRHSPSYEYMKTHIIEIKQQIHTYIYICIYTL